jgi:predicted RNA-binding Zn ribbon-like protein
MSPTARPALPALAGGRVSLDFANTLAPRRPEPGEQVHDYTPGYRELVAWAAHAGLLTGAGRQRLIAAAEADPAGAAAVLENARQLREAIYQAFAAIAKGLPAPPAALATIKDAYLEALRGGHLGHGPDGLEWHWPDDGPLEQVLWPLARSALDLAVSDQLARIKQCPGDDGRCGWLFLDTSKNATRRWCSMRTCGSRVKSRRQADRIRAARAQR